LTKLRDLSLIERKRRLARLVGGAKRRAIRFTEHLTGDGPTVFEHVCRNPIKSKPASAALRREREEEWNA
jgi:ATP-dependent DNA ligase